MAGKSQEKLNKAPAGSSNSMQEREPDRERVRAWVEQARQGDQEAFGELVKTYNQRVYNVVYQVVRHEDDARDLAQQTWVKAWKKLATFKGNAEFYTWVYRIAHFGAVDLLRKRQRRREDELLEAVEPNREAGAALAQSRNPRPDRQVEQGEMQEAFEAALEELSPEHRTALVLREIEGLSYDEIARVMKCRRGTVMSRIHYARKNVQEKLKDVR